jgi:hypothetical protein
MQRNATQRSAMQCNATQRSATQRNAAQLSATQRSAMHHITWQRSATQRNAAQLSTAQRNSKTNNLTHQSTLAIKKLRLTFSHSALDDASSSGLKPTAALALPFASISLSAVVVAMVSAGTSITFAALAIFLNDFEGGCICDCLFVDCGDLCGVCVFACAFACVCVCVCALAEVCLLDPTGVMRAFLFISLSLSRFNRNSFALSLSRTVEGKLSPLLFVLIGRSLIVGRIAATDGEILALVFIAPGEVEAMGAAGDWESLNDDRGERAARGEEGAPAAIV